MTGNLPNTELLIPSGHFFENKGYRFFIINNKIAIRHNSPVALSSFSGTLSVDLNSPIPISNADLNYFNNYVGENKIEINTYLTENELSGNYLSTVQYFDGLGRPKQVVNVKASPLGKDVVTHIEYDAFGRQVKDYLPVPQSNTLNGAIVPNPLANATQPGIYGSEKIYSEKILENSPLDRLLQQKQVGNAWNNKPVGFEYDANVAGEVIKYTTTTTWENGATKSTINYSGSYGAAQLYKNTVTDEDGNKTIEFKNGQGQTVLVRKMLNATEKADTYYVYNEYDQLAWVIPPLLSQMQTWGIAEQDALAYEYRYDGRNRLVEKKLPGKGLEYMVYDKADRLVATQDANLRSSARWLVTKYDKFGRVIYTGIMPLPGQTRGGLQTITNAHVITENTSTQGFMMSGMQVYYTNSLYSQIDTVLSVNYYDTYPSYSFNPAFPTTIQGQAVLTDNSTSNSISTKSMPVMSFVKNIEDDNWTKNYTWYDQKGRVIGTHSINHLGGYTKTESELDFAGVTKQAVTRHKRLNSDTEKVITENFTYDHQNRLLTHTHQVDNNPVEYLAQNDYNELSQLKTKKVGGKISGSGLQTIDYTYNIRGWMTGINDPNNLGGDLFGYKIKYNEVEGLQTPDTSDPSLQVLPRYNGNIAEVDWRIGNENDPLKRYGYVYDGLNRLSAGFYQNSMNASIREYYEKVTYDLNGNIKTMKRTAHRMGTTALLIDNLSYQYENANVSNRLQKINETVTTTLGYPYKATPTNIGYDVNGNMTSFVDKGISAIQYNFLNLPNQTIQNGRTTTNTYRADGVKLMKVFDYYGWDKTDYLDGFQYKNNWNETTMKLQFFPTSEGYYNDILGRYYYNYSDHLGNVRLSYSDTEGDGIVVGSTIKNCDNVPNGEPCMPGETIGDIDEVTNYYPFGMIHGNYYNSLSFYNYKYNGKELQETGMYDYGARFYMPDIGRWGVVDPLAETSRRFSPYTYVYNNPISFIDPTGMIGELATCPNCPNTAEFKPYIDSKTEYFYDSETNKVTKVGQIEEVKLQGSSSWNVGTRALGGLQMIGGTLEAVVGGVGGILTAETGVGAVVGWAVLMNGIDNATTGAQQLWTGEDEETLLHQGVEEGSLALGADEETAENIATGADVATLALGGGSSLKNTKLLRGSGGKVNGISKGSRSGYGAQKRFDIHPLKHPSRKTSRLTLPKWVKDKKVPVPHYHRGKGSNLKYHRPWEKGPDGKRRW
ncbi:RHS repeat-associated core domain-containing protein [Chryseobacterium sp. FDAARGOS 1104]|nr:RHS repeat-associated core domain-containing protein [Chryseobacterium sp. FDAARGOS 1104]